MSGIPDAPRRRRVRLLEGESGPRVQAPQTVGGDTVIFDATPEAGRAGRVEGRAGRWQRLHCSPIPAWRRQAAWLVTFGGVAALTLVLAELHHTVGLPTVLLLFLALVVSIAAIGGRAPAIVAAVLSFLSANWFFTPPYHRLTVAETQHVIALSVFLGVALVVSHFVDSSTRRAVEAAHARWQARTLAALAATIGEEDPLPTLLSHLRDVLAVEVAAILCRGEDRTWNVHVGAGSPPLSRPEDADVVEVLGPDRVLALRGFSMAPEDQLVLKAFAAQLAAVLERGRLRAEAGKARSLADANALRSAILQAVSHDLRTPLASIKASVSSLAQQEISWSEEETREFIRTINEETDRLTTLVYNLLDMSRIHAGVVQPSVGPVALEEVVPSAVASLGLRGAHIELDVPDTLPPVLADSALLERAVANLIANAVRFSPPDVPVHVGASLLDGHIDLCVVDRGPGIVADQREQVFQPFQRLGDSHHASGVGLGLAVARGFLTAIGATIELDETPGGGTTATVRLATAG